MLSDRDYMGGGRRRGPSGGDAVTCVFTLIGINAVVFILELSGVVNIQEFALSFSGLRSLKVWQLVSYMFLHGGWGHIFFNMWGLYMFGTVVGSVMDTNRFLWLYFISGIAGGVLFFLFNWNSPVVLLGASAAVSGVTLAAAMLYPNMQVMLLFPPIPMKMKTLAIVFIVLEVFFQLSKVQGGVAHLAHLGGVFGAYIFIKSLYGDNVWDPFDFILPSKGGAKRSGTTKKPKGWTMHSYPGDSTVSQKELDRILDKISAQGINSLTNEEMSALRRAREEMKK